MNIKLFSPRSIIILSATLLLASCASVQKFNQQITELHSPKEIKEDIDYSYNKLQKFHPDLYWYISKDSLDAKFNSLKNNINQPLSSKEFYIQLAPVIACIKQGHTSVKPPYLKQTREDKKEKGKREYIFKPLKFKGINNKLYISDNFGKDSAIIAGSELLMVDNEDTKKLLSSFTKLGTSDGYNKTFMPKFVATRFSSLFTNSHNQKDSLLLTLKYNDSTYTHYLTANYDKKKPKAKPIKSDSLKQKKHNSKSLADTTKHKQSKEELKLANEKAKASRKWKKLHGYSSYTKQCTRNFNFIESDSSNTSAYMKIRGFSNGSYKKFYQECFTKIDSAKTKNLIIDLRNNPGGRLAEIDYLYSYLTDKEYVFSEKAKMTKRTSYLYSAIHSGSTSGIISGIIFSPIIITHNLIKVKTEKGVPYFKFKSNKLQKPKPNNYKGKIYVLIDGTSFSASCILSTHLKATKRATFVGEETGGAFNGTVAGALPEIELPNTKVHIRAGMMTIKTPYTVNPDGYGIKPDIEIQSSTLEKDEELEWIINDVKRNK